jgi:hypothetical protein
MSKCDSVTARSGSVEESVERVAGDGGKVGKLESGSRDYSLATVL